MWWLHILEFIGIAIAITFGIMICLFFLFTILCYPALLAKKINLKQAEKVLKDNIEIVEESLYLAHMPQLQAKIKEANDKLAELYTEHKMLKAKNDDLEKSIKDKEKKK